jgi:hypothetical protein
LLGLVFVLVSCTLLYLSFSSSRHPDFDELPPPHWGLRRPPPRPWIHKHPGGEDMDIAGALPSVQDENAELWETRADKVKQAFVHAYSSYEKCARGSDELLPLTCKGTQK